MAVTPAPYGQPGTVGPQVGLPSTSAAGPASSNVVVLQHPAMRAMSLGALQARESEARAAAEDRQSQPLITGLAGHIHHKFWVARDARRFSDVEQRMIDNMRARRSMYTPQKLAAIRTEGGSEIYAGVTGQKCRAAAAWLRDTMMSTGEDRPWSIRPTAVPELPPEMNDLIVQQAMAPLKQQLLDAAQNGGPPPDPMSTVHMMSMMRDQALEAVRQEAAKRCDRMADKMEDQLTEGGFLDAMDDFINDLTTFPSAILKGPVIRMKPTLTWGPNNQPVVQIKLVKQWDRVDPFKFYPSPSSTCVDDGDMIEKHRLSRGDLQDLKGVPGYDVGAIDMVLENYGRSGLLSWLYDDMDHDDAAGRPSTTLAANPDGRIDALQYWGNVQGQLLLDWGMTKAQVPEATKEYQIEGWLIGPYVIKAMINPDPLNRKPYYATSFEKVPGAFWGHSVCDLVSDPQDICNAAARSMVNNAALASGPQVGILTDRIAPGEQITQLKPWRIWQLNSDPMGGSTSDPPIRFFQPQSILGELMQLFDKFTVLADEYSGIPRYMTGAAAGGGAGRTASGMSMMIGNAGKIITSVIQNIDLNIMEPLLERLYYFNMRYETDPDLKGDVCIRAKGASNITAKEAAQVRRNEFLATTANPIDMQIMGVEGRAAVLRETAKTLQMDTDKVVPDTDTLRQKLQAQQALAAQQAPGGAPGAGGGGPAAGGAQGGTPPGPGATEGNGQQLMNGAPVSDHFGPGM